MSLGPAVLCCLGGCLLIGLIIRDFSFHQLSTTQQPLETAPSLSAANDSAVTTQSLIDAQLFGRAATPTRPLKEIVQAAPETRLKLQLRGAFAHSNPQQSRALIAEQGQSAAYYRIGDQLPGGAKLEQIASEHVILKRSGVIETLSFAAGKNAKKRRPRYLQSSLAATTTSTTAIVNEAASRQSTASIKERLKRLREARDL